MNTGTLTFTNCVFSGQLLGAGTYQCGGFVGTNGDDNGGSSSFTDCLFAPAGFTVTRSATFSFNRNAGTASFTRAYYMQGVDHYNQGIHIYATAPHLSVKNAFEQSFVKLSDDALFAP